MYLFSSFLGISFNTLKHLDKWPSSSRYFIYLFFSGKFLLNEHILADYGVQRDSTLYLSVSWNAKNKHANSEEKINVTIQNVDGDFLTLEMRAVDTIEGLKITIEGQKSIPRKKQKLVYKGRVLKNQFTLRECNITMDSIIHLMHT